jgi:hypothetical protein
VKTKSFKDAWWDFPPLLKNVKISAGSNEILLDIAFGQTHFTMTDTKNTEQFF